jgi:hypothetical protein
MSDRKPPQHIPGAPRMLDTTQACAWLGLTYESLIRALRRGDVRGTKVGGKWLVYAELPPPPAPAPRPRSATRFPARTPRTEPHGS